jgi:glycosyltransferase involved in cell wall biosynthesis
MPESPFFSIIIPTYNRADLISRTIHSVLNQEYTNFEIIVVDDGSTDRTSEVIRSINDSRLKYFLRDNRERGAARNHGVQQARGYYITFVDSDDLLKPNHFTEAKKFLEANPGTGIFSLGYDIVYPDGKIQHPFRTLPNPVNRKLCEGNFLSCMGVFLKKEIITGSPFNEDRALSGSEDYELWLRLAARHPIVTVPVVTSAIVNHESRSVLQIDPAKLEQRRRLLKKYVWEDKVFASEFSRFKNKVNGYMDLYVALHLAIGSFRMKAAQKLMKAFVQYPPMVANYRFWVVIKKIILF